MSHAIKHLSVGYTYSYIFMVTLCYGY